MRRGRTSCRARLASLAVVVVVSGRARSQWRQDFWRQAQAGCPRPRAALPTLLPVACAASMGLGSSLSLDCGISLLAASSPHHHRLIIIIIIIITLTPGPLMSTPLVNTGPPTL